MVTPDDNCLEDKFAALHVLLHRLPGHFNPGALPTTPWDPAEIGGMQAAERVILKKMGESGRCYPCLP